LPTSLVVTGQVAPPMPIRSHCRWCLNQEQLGDDRTKEERNRRTGTLPATRIAWLRVKRSETCCNVPSLLHRNPRRRLALENGLVRGHDLGWNDRPHGAGRGPGHVLGSKGREALPVGGQSLSLGLTLHVSAASRSS